MTEPINAFFFRNFKNTYIPDILEEIYLKKVYDPFLAGKSDLIIADWGGNIGLTSYFFKDYAKKVYCVEPAKQHQEIIEKLIEFNKIPNIELCKYAISNKNGTTKFYHSPNTTMFSLSDRATNKDDFEEVETVTVDEFFKRNKIDHIDLLKLDVEGTEGQVVASEGFIKWAPKIKVIVGEYHEWASVSKDQFANMFRDLGYQFSWYYNTKASVFSAVL